MGKGVGDKEGVFSFVTDSHLSPPPLISLGTHTIRAVIHDKPIFIH